MSEWKKVRLGEVAELCLGKMLDAKKNKGTLRPYLNNVAVRWGCFDLVDLPEMRIEDAEVERYKIKKGDIVICEGGEPGRCAVWRSEEPIFFQKALHRARVKPCFDSDFIYYQLCYLVKSGETRNFETGSTIRHLPAQELKQVPVNLPPLPTQRRIAAVLSSLDDKIEKNRKICANLEAQAQAIFKSWFVDFEPFGGKMPQGWKMGKLGELIEVCYGKDHKALPEGDIPVFGSGGYMRSVDRCIYDEESVLIPRKGTLNNIMYVNEPFWTVDTMFYSKMREKHVAKYVHLLLRGKNMDEFNVGSAVPSMTTEILNNMEIIIPLTKTLQEFDGIANSIYAEVAYAKKESRSLAALRDALLPKLMSGEIDVEKVKISA